MYVGLPSTIISRKERLQTTLDIDYDLLTALTGTACFATISSMGLSGALGTR